MHVSKLRRYSRPLFLSVLAFKRCQRSNVIHAATTPVVHADVGEHDGWLHEWGE